MNLVNEFLIVMGTVTFVHKTSKTQSELCQDLKAKLETNKPFELDMGGPVMVVNPAPGMSFIVMTKEQFERNQGMARLVGKA